jgi:hypothetical protein
MGLLIAVAFGLVLAGGPPVRPDAGAVSTTALSASSRPRTAQWAPPTASVAPVPGRTRFSRRAGVSRVERGVTALGARTAVAPPRAWSPFVGSGQRPARTRRADATFERGPPPLS